MAEYAIMPLSDYDNACGAIREKTSITDAICSGDLASLISAIEGGGLKFATGSFTQVSTSVSTPKITHNLGTKKIVCLCWIPNDVTVVPTAGYQIIAGAFINAPAFFGTSIQVDCTGYNSGKFSDVSTVNYSSISLGAVLRSPWTSQNTFTAPNVSAGAISGSTVTEDTLVFKSSSSFIGGYTYNYIILGVE
jgi:hypothetical protein